MNCYRNNAIEIIFSNHFFSFLLIQKRNGNSESEYVCNHMAWREIKFQKCWALCAQESLQTWAVQHITDLAFTTDKLFWEAAAPQLWLIKDILQPSSHWSELELRKCSGKSSLYSESRVLGTQAANFGSSTKSLLDLQHIRRRTGVQGRLGAAFPSAGCLFLPTTCLPCYPSGFHFLSPKQKGTRKKNPL